MYPISSLFAAVTTLLAPRAGDVGEPALASAPAEIHPLATTPFGRFIRDELRPFSQELVRSPDLAAFEQHIDDFIDGEIGDRMFARFSELMSDGWSEEDSDSAEDLAALRERLTQVFGGWQAKELEEGFNLTLSVVARAPSPTDTVVLTEVDERASLSEMLNDVDLPLERRQLLLAGLESIACYLTLVHLAAEPQAVEPWLAKELVRRWIAGQAAVARQLALDEDSEVLAAQQLKHSLVNQGYERLARQGMAEGVDVWPPEVGNDD